MFWSVELPPCDEHPVSGSADEVIGEIDLTPGVLPESPRKIAEGKGNRHGASAIHPDTTAIRRQSIENYRDALATDSGAFATRADDPATAHGASSLFRLTQ